MNQTISRISDTMTTLFSMMFKVAERQADHQKLTHHLIEINKKQSSEEIINEVSICLKDILNYRLFALVIQKKKSVDVWLDPRMYKKSLEEIIINDFDIEGKEDLNYLNQIFQPDDLEEKFNMKDLIFYELSEDNFYSRIYMLPQENMRSYHDEMVNLIFQSCSVALSRQLKMENLRDAAINDPLTGCYNRREFETQLKRCIAGANRYKSPLSVFMFDLDHFKHVNDTYGHLAGDKVLQEVSKIVKKNVRTGDIVARYGGEEFIVLLPETDKTRAMELAERLRVKISKKVITHDDDTIKVTASFGVSQLTPNTEMTKIVQDADAMMYKAKLNGRNMVMPGVIKVIPSTDQLIFREITV